MMSILTSKANRQNDNCSGFGRSWDDEDYYPSYVGGSFVGGNEYRIATQTVAEQISYGGIYPGASQSVSFKPLIGILNQPKYLPLVWGGFVMEFEIISDPTEAFADSVIGGNFTPTDTGCSWAMSDIRLVGDVVTLDSALQNSYAEHALSGKVVPINYGTYITMQQNVVGDNISVTVSRAVSRFKTIFYSFNGDYNPTNTAKVNNPYYLVKKEFNYFYHPMGKATVALMAGTTDVPGGTIYDFNKEL